MILLIYDYSSFTSKLAEIRRFTESLGNALQGFKVKVIDGPNGIVEMDVGEILLEYNKECNTFPEFNASSILCVEEAVLNHQAGMLGIPGNISVCTLLHGIHLALIVGSLSRNKVIGDDAICEFIPTDEYDECSIRESIQLIGDVAEDKMESWLWNPENDISESHDERWAYEKRPINRIGDRVFKGALVIWPNLDISTGIYSNAFTTRRLSTFQEKKRFCSQHQRFLAILSHYSQTEPEPFLSIVKVYLGIGFDRFKLRKGGSYDFEMRRLVPPMYAPDFDFSRWVEVYAEEGGVLNLRNLKLEESPPDYLYASGEFCSKRDSVLSYGLRMKWLEERQERCWYKVQDLLNDGYDIDSLLSLKGLVSRFVICNRPPVWFIDYIALLHKRE
jgi:hypothetical protein